EELIGRPGHDLIHHTRPDGTPYPVEECPIYGAFRTGRGCHVDEDVLFRRDGSSFPAAYSSQPIHEGRSVLGAVVTFSDITERVAAQKEKELLERQLQQEALERRLQQAERLESLGQLAGGIAHDFNNLLAVILNYATFVADELDPASPVRADVAEIRRAAERAAALTHRLLI